MSTGPQQERLTCCPDSCRPEWRLKRRKATAAAALRWPLCAGCVCRLRQICMQQSNACWRHWRAHWPVTSVAPPPPPPPEMMLSAARQQLLLSAQAARAAWLPGARSSVGERERESARADTRQPDSFAREREHNDSIGRQQSLINDATGSGRRSHACARARARRLSIIWPLLDGWLALFWGPQTLVGFSFGEGGANGATWPPNRQQQKRRRRRRRLT